MCPADRGRKCDGHLERFSMTQTGGKSFLFGLVARVNILALVEVVVLFYFLLPGMLY